jgi:hypothetical protein
MRFAAQLTALVEAPTKPEAVCSIVPVSTFAWISCNRRRARDFEPYATTVAGSKKSLLFEVWPRTQGCAPGTRIAEGVPI